ncbi:MAG: Uma2 family endonuclease [Meiothermus sp.]
MAVANKLLTAEEFWLLPEGEGKRELVRGEVVEWMPVGGVHSDVAAELIPLLRVWAKSTKAGFVGGEAGYVVRRNPDGVRAADVGFVRRERIPEDRIHEAFWNLAPDLAVEVVSPSETAEEIWEKFSDYLAAGTPLVWVIYPRSKQAVVHTPDGIGRTLNAEDKLESPTVLPGFSCKLGELSPTQ